MKVKIKNFQSLKDVEFDFPVGVTVITGPNNTGKTSCQRAIRAAITNKFNPEDLSWGEKEASVELEFDDGYVRWSRTEDKSVYDLKIADKQFPTFKKTERKVPPEVASYLNMSPLEIDNFKLPLNLLGQWESFFFVEESGTKISRILGRLSGVDQIFDKMKDVSEDFSTAAKKLNDLNFEVECLKKEKTEAQERYEVYLEKYNEAKTLYQKYNDISSKVLLIKNIVQNVVRIRQEILIKKIDISRLDVSSLRSLISSLKSGIDKALLINTIISGIRNSSMEKNKLSSVMPLFSYVESIFPGFSSFVQKKNKIEEILLNIRYAEQKRSVSAQLVKKSEEIATMAFKLRGIFSKIQELAKYTSIKEETYSAKKRIFDIERELEAVKEEQSRIKACPLCSRTF